jgi:hypothetical protein
MRILRGRGTLSLRRHHTSRIQERRHQDLRWPPAARWLQATHPPRARHTLPLPPPHLTHPGASSPRSSLASGRTVATSCPSWPPPRRGAQGALQQGRLGRGARWHHLPQGMPPPPLPPPSADRSRPFPRSPTRSFRGLVTSHLEPPPPSVQ